jgi:hypothetical protein
LTACWTTATTPAEEPRLFLAATLGATLAVTSAGSKVLDQQVARPQSELADHEH